jgi:hypothetical protein
MTVVAVLVARSMGRSNSSMARRREMFALVDRHRVAKPAMLLRTNIVGALAGSVKRTASLSSKGLHSNVRRTRWSLPVKRRLADRATVEVHMVMLTAPVHF